MQNGFKFGDFHTSEFSMYVEKFPVQVGAKRKGSTVAVPGRNGDLHFLEDAFCNYIQPYACYFHGDLPTPEQAHAVKAWLLGDGAYRRLEDTYDPNHFRLATFHGPLDIDNILNKYGRCTVNFDCAPQSFLKSGENPVEFAAAGVLHNPTAFEALPLITVYGTDAGTVTIGGATVKINAITAPIVLDCDTQNAYSQPGEGAPENQNGNIRAVPFPSLAPGENVIAFTGGITKLEIIPRWWEL